MHRRSCGIAGVFALLLAMLLMACNPNAENATGTASLTVTVSDETAKLITPDVDNVDISHYKVIITNPVGAYYDSGYLDKGESFTVSGLVSGEWDVKAEAYVNTAGTDVESAMVKVATTETAKVTMAGENKEIELVFDTLEETAAGTVTVTLLLPSGIADGSFSYWYDVTDMSGTPVDLADKGSENAPLTGTAASGTAQLSISGLNQGSYLLYVSVMDGDTPVTAVDAMRLIASTDAVGTLDFAGSSEATSVSVGLTVEDLIGDILEFSLKDGTEFNFTEDTFSLAFPEAYSYKWYVDGNDWNSKVAEKESSGDSGAEGDTGTASNYQAYTLSGLSSLGIGRHVLTVVAYLPDMQISVGSVDIILNKVNIGVEIPSEEVTVSYYDLAKHLELGDNEINMGFTKDGGGC